VTFVARIQAAHLDAVAYWKGKRADMLATEGGGNLTLARQYNMRADRHLTQARLLAEAMRRAA
jgi:hypothetical protein